MSNSIIKEVINGVVGLIKLNMKMKYFISINKKKYGISDKRDILI